MIETSLAPGLLLAMPQLVDPNFSRAVVLMIEHNDEGSFGLIVNQPSDLPAAELLAGLDIPWGGDEDERVWSGGPVMPPSVWLLHARIAGLVESESFELGGTVRVGDALALSTSPEAVRQIAEQPPRHTRLLLGYSGWGPGQLASEMARGSWLHADLSPEVLFDTTPDEMWSAALRSIGVDPETVVPSRGIH